MKRFAVLFAVAAMTFGLFVPASYASRVCEDFQSCAEASIERNGYVTGDCKQISNNRQDRCAAASIEKNGYVTSSCLSLP